MGAESGWRRSSQLMLPSGMDKRGEKMFVGCKSCIGMEWSCVQLSDG